MKTLSCPECNSANTCPISYGYPADEEEYLQLVAEKKIYPGGCCIDSNSFTFYCNDCGSMWGKLDENEESVDYGQDSDLNVV